MESYRAGMVFGIIEPGGLFPQHSTKPLLFLECYWSSCWGRVISNKIILCALGLLCGLLTVLILDLNVVNAVEWSPSFPVSHSLAYLKDMWAIANSQVVEIHKGKFVTFYKQESSTFGINWLPDTGLIGAREDIMLRPWTVRSEKILYIIRWWVLQENPLP